MSLKVSRNWKYDKLNQSVIKYTIFLKDVQSSDIFPNDTHAESVIRILTIRDLIKLNDYTTKDVGQVKHNQTINKYGIYADTDTLGEQHCIVGRIVHDIRLSLITSGTSQSIPYSVDTRLLQIPGES